jgi:CBS domain-containing protein
MATARDILAKKGCHVWTIGPAVSVYQAALLMNEHKIGSLAVLDQGRLLGVFTERDVLQRVVGERRDPAETPVSAVMTADVVCCGPDTPLEEARAAMMNRRVRHLPVMEDDRMLGMISIGDLNAYETANHEQTIFLLSEYLYGRV